MRHYLELGSWNVICDRCGLQFKNHELKSEWTGLKVCTKCWESRHPQTLLRSRPERITPPWVRPEAEDTFVSVPDSITTEDNDPIMPESLFMPLQTES